jgi:hypothetical protein
MNINLTKYHKAGFKLLTNYIRKKYPFILDVTLSSDNKTWYGTAIVVDIKFDLEKFYQFENVYPPKKYDDAPFLYRSLGRPGLYLGRYVDDNFNDYNGGYDRFGYKYNDEVKEELDRFYKHLPEYMRFFIFEGFEDSDFKSQKEYRDGDLDFYKKWQNKKEPVHINIGNWIPVFDLSKYYTEENN